MHKPDASFQPGAVCTGTIIDLALPDGLPLMRHEGMVIFLDKGVVGDTVEVRIVEHKKKFAYGIVQQVLEPSLQRVKPLCPYSGTCGGCVCQDYDYDHQLEIKTRYLRKTLASIGGVAPEKIDNLSVEPACSTFWYRNKTMFTWGTEDGKPAPGLQQRVFLPGSHGGFVRVDQCPITSHQVTPILEVCEQFFANSGLTAYDPETHTGVLRNLMIRESKHSGETMVVLYTTPCDISDIESLYNQLSATVPAVSSFYWILHTRSFDAFGGYDIAAQFGKPHITERCAGLWYRIYPQTFFQPNTAVANAMYPVVGEFAKKAGANDILGLYCGSGGIELYLAKHGLQVTGVDANPDNITAARENCQLNGIDEKQFFHATVEQFVHTNPNRSDHDLVLIDPPRSGMTPRARTLIAGLKIPNIIYISCNPATMARDLSSLRTRGFAVESIRAFDQFPHTAHMETVALLTRT